MEAERNDPAIYNGDDGNNLRHCERSEAIHADTPVCFALCLATPRNDGETYFLDTPIFCPKSPFSSLRTQ
jgi:hypothetical protein